MIEIGDLFHMAVGSKLIKMQATKGKKRLLAQQQGSFYTVCTNCHFKKITGGGSNGNRLPLILLFCA